MENSKRPKEPGLYAARPRDYKWWPYLYRVSGEAPYLEIKLIENRSFEPSCIEDLEIVHIKEPSELNKK